MDSISETDLKQIESQGIEQEELDGQLLRFRKGFPPMEIVSAAKVGDGILKLSDSDSEKKAVVFENSSLSVVKFVPASGAASRMFKQLFSFVDHYDGSSTSYDAFVSENPSIDKFFKEIKRFAFYQELSDKYQAAYGYDLNEALSNREFGNIADLLLSEDGLNYGNLPKGLLAFHLYAEGSRTPAFEHVVEGLAYAKKEGKTVLHFTVSPEHQQLFSTHLEHVTKSAFPSEEIEISFSTQQPSTDTVAATPDFNFFRKENGALLFRPAGHGALLENLNQLDSDIVFVKNIDNVVPDRIKEPTIKYKKVLAGILLEKQEKVFDLLKRNDRGEDISKEGAQLVESMGCKGFRSEEISSLLNRPIRVCGMVENEGEPGGGPFWVNEGERQTLQIVESAQIDTSDSKQVQTFKTGTHFNPVDIVFGRKNYKGEPFDLIKYRDANAGFISEKSAGGKKLLAMELPGLWNGSMSDWNTIFMEVPIVTFNPVKEVTDLLKENHQPM